MLTHTRGRVVLVTAKGDPIFWGEKLPGEPVPDLRDPATLGCLLALVREVWDEPLVQAELNQAMPALQWCVWVGDDVRFYGATEAEALVAALEAAP